MSRARSPVPSDSNNQSIIQSWHEKRKKKRKKNEKKKRTKPKKPKSDTTRCPVPGPSWSLWSPFHRVSWCIRFVMHCSSCPPRVPLESPSSPLPPFSPLAATTREDAVLTRPRTASISRASAARRTGLRPTVSRPTMCARLIPPSTPSPGGLARAEDGRESSLPAALLLPPPPPPPLLDRRPLPERPLRPQHLPAHRPAESRLLE